MGEEERLFGETVDILEDTVHHAPSRADKGAGPRMVISASGGPVLVLAHHGLEASSPPRPECSHLSNGVGPRVGSAGTRSPSPVARGLLGPESPPSHTCTNLCP